MKRFLSLLLLAAAALVIAAAWLRWSGGRQLTQQPADAQPLTVSEGGAEGELRFPRTTVDLGTVTERASCRLTYVNCSDVPVTITSVNPSCNCLTPRVDKSTLPPGESGQLTVDIDPGRQPPGRHVHVVDLEYAGRSRHAARLAVAFVGRPEFSCVNEVEVRTTTGQPSTVRFEVVDHREPPLSILRVESSDPRLSARAAARDAARPGALPVELTLDPRGLAAGTHFMAVSVHTDDPARRVITVRACVRHSQRLRAAPAVLLLSPAAGGGLSGKLFLSDTEGQELEVDSVTAAAVGGFSYRVEPRPGGLVVHVTVAASPEPRPQSFPAVVTVKRPLRESVCVEVRLPQS